MGYKNANQVLPEELITQLQEYIDGEYLYIPRKKGNERSWGEKSGTKEELLMRNKIIHQKYRTGTNKETLAEEYHLSIKSIERIIYQ
ncbi:CD3324 family protein [Bacillus carboniphilus]|uniref:CD3324 family protein n=1 Tax=Bacillus carboniphilus TaxID=86663 RepID=A0ABY9JXK1_9BACI|nr:CD3324 family protein [Bacillus carboniphilus]WLR42350.1 CD3324 family protein [Bacillus carboniphilus]